jgi:threonine/homoserine/homoserine lactone efflux protein
VEWALVAAMALFSVALGVSPGPNNAALLAISGTHGFRGAVSYLWGMVWGLAVLVTVMAVGLGALLELFPTVYLVMKYVAFGYVIFLAWKTVRSKPADGSSSDAKPVTVWQSALFQLVNPKAWIATGTLIAAYVPQGANAWSFVIAGATFIVATMPGAMLWAGAGQAVKFLLAGSRAHRIFTWVMAFALVGSMVPVLFLMS